MGLVLVGCDKDDGDDSSSSNNNNNSGNPNTGGNGNNSLSIRITGKDYTSSATTFAIYPDTFTTMYVRYQNPQGNWVTVPAGNTEGFSIEWYKNGSPVLEFRSVYWIQVTRTDKPFYGTGGTITANRGDTISVTVTHTDGRTAFASIPVGYVN